MLETLPRHRRTVDHGMTVQVTGRVIELTGLTIVAEGLPLPVGATVRIGRSARHPVPAQVVGFRGDRAVLMAFEQPLGIAAGDPVTSTAALQHVPVGRRMLGAVLDGLGRPIGGHADFTAEDHYPLYADPPPALQRRAIDAPLPTGVRVIDALHTVGGGQRMGVFAGTGVGKSVLMGMIARFTSADVNVVALIGERGREVNDFLQKDLGEAGLARTVVVVSTSDQSPVLRVRGGFVATAVAEYFRDQGADCLLMMDSVTRIAMAQRQIGLAAGEPPTAKGYPPSVFDLLPRLVERCGRTQRGGITGLYNVLVEGDDLTEPISDALRGVLDGHLWLSRGLANRAHFPAVSVLESISRVMPDVTGIEHRRAAEEIRRTLAVWTDHEDLIAVGAYVPGADASLDAAVRTKPAIDEFLRQAIQERANWDATHERLIALAGDIRSARGQAESRKAGGSAVSTTGAAA